MSPTLGTVPPYQYVVGTTGHLQIHKPLQFCTARVGDVVPACPCVPARHAYMYIYMYICVCVSVGLGLLEIWVFLAAWAATTGCGAGEPAPSQHRQGRVPEPALRWKREEAERIVKPAALSDLPVFTAEPEPSSSSAAQLAPSPLLTGYPKSLPGPFMAPGEPSQDLLGRREFSNAIGLGCIYPQHGGLACTDTRACTACSPAAETLCQ